MKKTLFSLITVALLATACGANAPAPTPTMRADYKLGIVLNEGGTIRDGTFNEISYTGAQLAARDFGLDFNYKETISAKDYTPSIEAFVKEGRNIIVTVGFQMTDDTIAAAKKYPNLFFIGVDESVADAPANFAGVVFREDEGGFLAGALAGMMTKSNVVAVLGGQKIPPVERYVNGFINGVRYVNSGATALSTYTSSFIAAEEGRQKAQEFIDQKADVIFGAGGFTGSSGIAFAASKKVYVIGVDQDEFRTTFKTGSDANFILSSAVKRVDTGVYTSVKSVLDKNFKGGDLVLGAAQCGVSYAPFHNTDSAISGDVKSKLETIWRALAGGTLLTGVKDGTTAPEPLKAGEMPKVADTAPKFADCTRN